MVKLTDGNIIFRQLIIRSEGKYLVAENSIYETIMLYDKTHRICGVIEQARIGRN